MKISNGTDMVQNNSQYVMIWRLIQSPVEQMELKKCSYDAEAAAAA